MKRVISLPTVVLLLGAAAAHAGEGEDALARCWQHEDGHPAVSTCIEREVRRAKVRLEQVEKLRRIDAVELDEAMMTKPSRLNALRASSHNFDEYVERECRRQALWALPGNGGDDHAMACEITLIHQRIRILGEK